MKYYKTYYQRNLPHYHPEGYALFVTFRLINSLPLHIIKELQEKNDKLLKHISGISDKRIKSEFYREHHQNYFEEFDGWLDRYKESPRWLGNANAANVVKEAIHFNDDKDYELLAFTIMPNHVHIVFTPIVDRDSSRSRIQDAEKEKKLRNGNDINVVLQDRSISLVADILRKIKGSTARECNKILSRTGAFWQHESYDHVIRDEIELKHIVEYVLNNPVKARLCEKWEDWAHSYCNFEKM